MRTNTSALPRIPTEKRQRLIAGLTSFGMRSYADAHLCAMRRRGVPQHVRMGAFGLAEVIIRALEFRDALFPTLGPHFFNGRSCASFIHPLLTKDRRPSCLLHRRRYNFRVGGLSSSDASRSEAPAPKAGASLFLGNRSQVPKV